MIWKKAHKASTLHQEQQATKDAESGRHSLSQIIQYQIIK